MSVVEVGVEVCVVEVSVEVVCVRVDLWWLSVLR